MACVKLRRIDLNHEEFLAAVSGEMTPAELGVYWMICLLQYNRGGQSIRYDMEWLRRKFTASPRNRAIKGIVDHLVKTGRLMREGDELWSSRVRAEYERGTSLIRAYTENGRKGGRPRKNINEVAKPNGFDDQKDTTTTTTTIKKEDFALSSESEESSPTGSHATAPRRPRATKTPPMIPIEQWGPSPAHQQQAMLAGHDDAWLFDQADRYRDQQATKRDKDKHRDREAGFRNWIRNAPDFERRLNGHTGNGKFKPSPMNNFAKGFADALRERQEAREREENLRADPEPAFALLDS